MYYTKGLAVSPHLSYQLGIQFAISTFHRSSGGMAGR